MNLRTPINARVLFLAFSSTALIAVLPTCIGSLSKPDWHSEKVTILEGATLIDGTGSVPVKDAAVVVHQTKIVAIGKRGEFGRPPRAEIIDLRGQYIVPGFIDVHAHMPFGPVNVSVIDGMPKIEVAYDTKGSEQMLRSLLSLGVTTIRSPGGHTQRNTKLKQAIAEGRTSGPDMVVAGHVIEMHSPIGIEGLTALVASDDEIRAEVRRQISAGVDFIKLYYQLPPDLVRAGINEAHKGGVKALAHLGPKVGWAEAADAGLDGLLHLPSDSRALPEQFREEFQAIIGTQAMFKWFEYVDLDGPEVRQMIDALIRNDVTVDPTLVLYDAMMRSDQKNFIQSLNYSLIPKTISDSWSRFNLNLGWRPEDYKQARQAKPKIFRFVNMLHSSGVLLLAGTDAPNPWVVPGTSLHREIELLAETGIPNIEVIKIATLNGAMGLGLDHVKGSVEVGKTADLVLLNQNPLDDIRATRSIVWVMKAGTIHYPSSTVAQQMD